MSWKDNIRRVTPYTPGEQPVGDNIIKLNTNENPYPPSEAVKRVIDEFDYEMLRKYPKPDIAPLRDAIADNLGVSSDNVFVGVGSDDVIAMSYMTFFNSDKPILFADVTYSFYDVWAEEFGVPYKTCALSDDFRLVKSDYMQENGGIIIANPNAPTGILESVSFIEEIVAANPDSVVIVDEAYIDFGGTSAVSLINKYDNVLVTQTFSKSRSLAGSRIGYAVGSSELIGALCDVKYSFNSYTIDSLTMDIGTAAIGDAAYFDECCQRIMATRERACERLTSLGFSYPKSSANFVFAQHKSVPAAHIFDELRKRNIYVRYFNKNRIDNYLRITIGTDEEMDALFLALEEIL